MMEDKSQQERKDEEKESGLSSAVPVEDSPGKSVHADEPVLSANSSQTEKDSKLLTSTPTYCTESTPTADVSVEPSAKIEGAATTSLAEGAISVSSVASTNKVEKEDSELPLTNLPEITSGKSGESPLSGESPIKVEKEDSKLFSSVLPKESWHESWVSLPALKSPVKVEKVEFKFSFPNLAEETSSNSGKANLLVESVTEDEEEESGLAPAPAKEETSGKITESGSVVPLLKTEDSTNTSSLPSASNPPPIRAGSPEKKIINLNTIAISNMFKNPSKQNTPTGDGVAKMDTSDTTIGQIKPEPQRTEFLKLSMALANAIKSDPKKKVFCANTNCNVKTDTVFDVSSHARLYFGMPKFSVNPPKICSNCFKKAEQYHQKSKALVKNKENLFKLTFEIQTSSSDAMVDLDSPVNSPQGSDSENEDEKFCKTDMYSISLQKMKDVLDETLQKFDLEMQLKNCATTVNNEVEDLAVQFSSLDIQLDQLRDKIEVATKTYNENIATQSKAVVIGFANIDAQGTVTVREAENLSGIEGLGRLGARALNKAVEDFKSVGIDTGVRVPQTQQFSPQIPLNNRRMAKLIFVKPKEGQDVIAMHRHSLFYWLPAKILKISLSTAPNRPTMYLVQFQQRIKSRNKTSDESDTFIKEVTGKQLAFKKPSSITLPVGTRIIAKFKDLLNTDIEVDGMLYAGIVAEVPKGLNKFRYLVFFDDGYAQYVLPNEVLPVVESSPDVWIDVHKNSQDFIRDYVMKFPDRHMIRAEIGANFTVELNGCWLPARIADVDGSLMKVQYLKKAEVQYEWIYRGSTRLGPLFSRLKSLEAKPTATVARRHTYSSRKTNFSFEMNRDCDDEDAQPKVARRQPDVPKIPSKQGQVIRAKNGMIISTFLESEGNMIKIQIPRDCPSPRPFVPHNCSRTCAYRYEEEDYRKVSPLAIPFYLGWARELSGANRDKVFYHTPCGVRCGNYLEIHSYITKTGAEIPIDFFSMESNVDCLNEFEPLRKMEYLKDISYGAEWTPISCVNSLDRELPLYMQYITERVPTVGVEINEDDGFLTCCDCEDDCQDKDKCACWQQTFSGISFKLAEQDGAKLFGYENRRLKNHILSGIYECNRKCKCRSTCFNRVVQNKVQWPIQLFKTIAKGWGVRALHDMPQGTFICVYTGQLLTDASANEAGREAGDEYLAELDFIECNEQMKEDYESDATDIEIEEQGTKSTARLARQTSLQNKPTEETKKQEVAKKSTIQKAVKSTGGVKRRSDSDARSTISTASTKSSHSSVSNAGRPVARKSGSKNGSSLKKNGVAPSNPGSSGVPSPASSKVSGGDSDSDDDSNVPTYSSFSASVGASSQKNAPRLPLREYFGKYESVYIMDAKNMGNFGRYLNHSCDPNVFVQNLFVDTHDPRFPWVAFFTKKDVKAGTELTWDYNYDIGSVPTKTLYCYCLMQGCRGRLL